MKTKLCKCGGTLKLDQCLSDGFVVDCMKCDKCGDILFTKEQTQILIKLREPNKNIEGKRKIVKVGSSIAALLPKRVEDYGIKEGMVDDVKVLSQKSLQIKFSKEII